jgi:hypothetical protein
MGLLTKVFGGGAKTSSGSSAPWKPAQPYILGQTVDAKGKIVKEKPKTIRGIFPEAQSVYDSTKTKAGAIDGVGVDQAKFGDSILGGAYNVSKQNFNAAPVDMVQARASQGALDPSTAIQSLLSGNVNNPYLDKQAQAITSVANRNLLENIMPQVNGEASMAGQYGGSRQGIAQGQAIGRTNEAITNSLSNLYGGAYENAQNRMQGTATDLNNQAYSNAQTNAARGLEAEMGTANSNAVAQNQNLNTMMQGITQKYGGIQNPINFAQGNLQNYSNIINQPNGGTSTSKQNGAGPIPGMIGAGLSIFSDRRLKKDIELIGKYENGLNKYSWTYIWGEKSTGAMADEVEQLIPEAVGMQDGFKTVNYAMIGA